MNYQNTYIGRNLNALSQLMNALINGNPDVSISARIGQNNYYHNIWFYKLCGWIVDKTFEPIDGKDHCENAYLRDRKEDYTVGKGWIIGEVLMVMIVVLACIPLSVLFWGYKLISKIWK
jgi:hypothetical protein